MFSMLGVCVDGLFLVSSELRNKEAELNQMRMLSRTSQERDIRPKPIIHSSNSMRPMITLLSCQITSLLLKIPV